MNFERRRHLRVLKRVLSSPKMYKCGSESSAPLNWFLEACSISIENSRMKRLHRWFFSDAPDIMVSQTGSATRGMLYRSHMVILGGGGGGEQTCHCLRTRSRCGDPRPYSPRCKKARRGGGGGWLGGCQARLGLTPGLRRAAGNLCGLEECQAGKHGGAQEPPTVRGLI